MTVECSWTFQGLEHVPRSEGVHDPSDSIENATSNEILWRLSGPQVFFLWVFLFGDEKDLPQCTRRICSALQSGSYGQNWGVSASLNRRVVRHDSVCFSQLGIRTTLEQLQSAKDAPFVDSWCSRMLQWTCSSSVRSTYTMVCTQDLSKYSLVVRKEYVQTCFSYGSRF